MPITINDCVDCKSLDSLTVFEDEDEGWKCYCLCGNGFIFSKHGLTSEEAIANWNLWNEREGLMAAKWEVKNADNDK